MRKLGVSAASSLALFLSVGLPITGCTDDPQDPQTWIKKLDDVREQQNAVRQLVKLKDPVAYEGLAKLFKRTKDPEQLKAIGKLRTDAAVDLFIEQLDYSDDNFENAAAAATGLAGLAGRDDKGRQAAAKAVDALGKAIVKKLPIKTRANVVKAEAMTALGAIKDPRAVEALDQVLETPADDQDFFLNKEAARHLAEFADKRSVPSLVRGLFMTGRGKDIFQTCRLALVRIGGDAAADALVQAMQRKNQALEADAKKYEFIPGIVVQKTSIVLADLRNKKVVPALFLELGKKDDGLAPGGVSGHQSVIQALGLIGDTQVAPRLQAIVADPKRLTKYRAAAASALNFLNASDAEGAILTAAKTVYVNEKKKEIDQDKAQLAAEAVTEYSRLIGGDRAAALVPLFKAAPAETDISVAFKNALFRSEVAKACGKDVACYGKLLGDPISPKSEKAAFMLGRFGHGGVAYLAKGVNHKDSATRFAVLFSLTRVAGKDDKDALKAIDDQIEIDKTKPPLLPLVDEMRVTQAIVLQR